MAATSKKLYTKYTALTIEGALERAEELAQRSLGWAKHGDFLMAAQSEIRADELLDLVDVQLTGSVGASCNEMWGKTPVYLNECYPQHNILGRIGVIREFIKKQGVSNHD